jgi:hypothetical protein
MSEWQTSGEMPPIIHCQPLFRLQRGTDFPTALAILIRFDDPSHPDLVAANENMICPDNS